MSLRPSGHPLLKIFRGMWSGKGKSTDWRPPTGSFKPTVDGQVRVPIGLDFPLHTRVQSNGTLHPLL
jgi:hypothetical protein